MDLDNENINRLLTIENIGKKDRIFNINIKEDIKILNCPNNIFIFTNPLNKEIRNITNKKKVKKGEVLFTINDKKFISDGFYKIMEINEKNENYFLICLKLK